MRAPSYFRAAALFAFLAALIIACGTSEESVFVPPGLDDGGLPPPTGQFGVDGGGGPVGNSGCKPLTCKDQGIECGPAGDGCGGIIADCGKCGSGLRCGGPGAPSKCVSPSIGTGCVPKTCAQQGVECGLAGDGCGGVLTCGTCAVGQQCGAVGQPSKCVTASATGPDGGACVAKTCADYLLENKDCGRQSDGCGGTIDCGVCVGPEFCGGGGPSKCAVSGGGACVPKTCADFPGKCGQQSDGCGGVTPDCMACVAPEICGGGGVPSVCGGGVLPGPGGGPCVPRAVCGGTECGKVADGCGGVLDCGIGNCAAGATCGGAGVPNQCGAPPCVKLAACPAGLNCGSIADGCGGIVSCGGACAAPAICGGGGVANVCGGGVVTADGGPGGGPCVPLAVCPVGSCGPIADGCGGVKACGNCISPALCGGGGTPSVCGGGNQCTPTTQAVACQGMNCGFAPDGCGGLHTCGIGAGVCPNGGICGATVPNVCGIGTQACFNVGDTCAAGADCCTGYCGPNLKCAAQACIPDTPVPGACNDPTECCSGICTGGLCQPVNPGGCTTAGNGCGINAECCSKLCQNGKCTADVSFCTQKNEVCFENKQCCSGSCVKGAGNANGICGDPGGGGVGQCNVAGTVCPPGAVQCDQSCCSRSCGPTGGKNGFNVCQNPSGCHPVAELCRVDSDCCGWAGSPDPKEGQPTTCSKTNPTDEYGRCGQQGNSCKEPGMICKVGGDNSCSTSNNCCETLNQPAGNCNSTPENCCRPDAQGIPRCLINYVGDCAVKPADGTICASSADCCGNPCVPDGAGVLRCNGACITNGNACTTTKDCCGGACIKQPGDVQGTCTIPSCTPKTCADYPGRCGAQSDGCGGMTPSCGACVYPETCGGGGVPNQCGGTICTATTCAALGAECGSVPDGCGGVLACPNCPAGQTCGGGGVANKCGAPACTPLTCAAQGVECGQTGDGCGNAINCPPCPAGTTCGGGGVPNKCGAPACVPLAACPPGKNCGDIPDTCGGSIHCGDCPAGQNCGGGGAANVCGAASCVAKSCAQQGAQCGIASDGCGGVVNCPPCGPNQFCNAQNVCVGLACTPKTCQMLGVQCGPTADGCGGLLNCGPCPLGQGCGAGGVPGVCGTLACTPKTCAELGAVCGQVANGCGGLTPACGTCAGNLSCKNGACVQACTPQTCAQVGANCGQIADGCGAVIDCGICPEGFICGYGGKANVCGIYQPK